MPDFPGLHDSENCRDWQAGIPIDFKKIRAKDGLLAITCPQGMAQPTMTAEPLKVYASSTGKPVLAICYVTFLVAGRIARTLGTTGNVVLSRLLGVLLAALAVQYVIDGIRAVLAS